MSYYLRLTDDEAELLERIMKEDAKHVAGQSNPQAKMIHSIYEKLKNELIKSDLERKFDEVRGNEKNQI